MRIASILVGTTTLALAISSQASGALVATSSVARSLNPITVGNYTELAEFTPTSESSGGSLNFAMTGDLRLELDPGALAVDYRYVDIRGAQNFEINGPLPMEITPEGDMNFKLAHAGGPADSPFGDGDASAALRVYETGGYVHGDPTLAGLGQAVLSFSFDASESMSGNGSLIHDIHAVGDSYVLLPGTSYTAVWSFGMYNTTDGLEQGDLPAAAFYEAGGISGFSGINFSLNAVAVPAPGGAVIAAMGGMLVARRRRHN